MPNQATLAVLFFLCTYYNLHHPAVGDGRVLLSLSLSLFFSFFFLSAFLLGTIPRAIISLCNYTHCIERYLDIGERHYISIGREREEMVFENTIDGRDDYLMDDALDEMSRLPSALRRRI